MTFLGVLWQVIPLGIAAAFTPSLLALQILIVSGDPWRKRALAVAVGGSAAFVLVGFLLLVGFRQLPDIGGDLIDPFGTWLRIVAGLALWLAAAYLFRPHPALQARAEHDIGGYVAHASTWVFLGIAFALSIKDVSSFIVLAPALRTITASRLNDAEQAALVVILYALALSPVLLPPALRLLFGHRIDAAFKAVYRFTLVHQFQLVGSMAAIVGGYLLISGIVRL
ncbi:MAG: GAP family protein [Actinobacteria bacterium]|nr:GAP family protein [Actinomycetota bacterium]